MLYNFTDGELSKMFGRPRVKIIERVGTSLESILCSKNPWSQEMCGRRDCHVCKEGSKSLGQCRKEGVIYSLTCQVCARKGVRKKYWGETGRSSYERCKEHWDLWRNRKESSCLWKHSMEEHGGGLKEEDVLVKVEEQSRTTLSRQVGEGVRIEEEEPGALLNSKSEFGHNRVPRLRIEMGNTILRGERVFEEGRTREELEEELIRDEDREEGEREYQRIWGVPRGEEEMGEGGKRKGSSKEENGGPRKRRKLEKGEDRELWEMKEISWWRWGREVRWEKMNELE